MRKKILNKFILKETLSKYLDEIIEIVNESSPDPWKRNFFSSELDVDNSVFIICIEEDSGIVVGFLIFRLFVDFIEIINIAVRKKYRMKGVGREMMDYLYDSAKRKNIGEVYLEVRESNFVARKFYNQCDFSIVSKRNFYYKNPLEHALVLKRNI